LEVGGTGDGTGCNYCHAPAAGSAPTNPTINGQALTFGSLTGGPIIPVVAGSDNNLITVNITATDANKRYAGFLVAHNDASTNDAAGTLKIDNPATSHACKGDPLVARSNGNAQCGTSTGNNTEVMHETPIQGTGVAPNISIPLSFRYKPPNSGACGLYQFKIFINNVNHDLLCNNASDY